MRSVYPVIITEVPCVKRVIIILLFSNYSGFFWMLEHYHIYCTIIIKIHSHMVLSKYNLGIKIKPQWPRIPRGSSLVWKIFSFTSIMSSKGLQQARFAVHQRWHTHLQSSPTARIVAGNKTTFLFSSQLLPDTSFFSSCLLMDGQIIPSDRIALKGTPHNSVYIIYKTTLFFVMPPSPTWFLKMERKEKNSKQLNLKF